MVPERKLGVKLYFQLRLDHATVVPMGAHLTNPNAIAKANGMQAAQVMDLGDGIVCGGFQVVPLMRPASDEEGAPMVLVAGLVALAGKSSPLAIGIELRPVLLGEIGGIPLDQLKKAIQAKPDAEQAAQ